MTTSRTRTGTDLAVGTGIGAFSGAFGVGGGIMLVPFQVLVRKVPQKQAQATSLVMVAMAAFAGAVRYAANGDVAWWPSIVIVLGGLAGAWLGAHLMQRSPGWLLQALFGGLVVIAGARILSLSTAPEATVTHLTDPSAGLLLGYALAGLGMGVLSALFGIGGGILLVPVLVAVFDYTQHMAAGTSLAVMVPIALVGAFRLTRPGLTKWAEGARYGIGAIVGAFIGASLALMLSGGLLRLLFGVLMLIVGAQMSWKAWRNRRIG